MDERSVMSGVIEGNDGTFFRDGYRVTIMPLKLPLNEEVTTITPENGYLHVTSFRGKKGAFFAGKEPFSICSDIDLTTPVFIESYMPIVSNDLHHFFVIEFFGGSLNLLRKERFSLPQYAHDATGHVSFDRPLEKSVYEMSIAGKNAKSR